MASSENRDHLLDATAELVARHGYHGTGVNAVLAASGVPNGSLYHFFPAGKDELITASIVRTGQQTREQLAEVMRLGPERATKAIFAYLIARLEDDGFEAGCRVASPLADAGPEAVAVRTAAAEAFASWVEVIAAGLVAAGWKAKAARATAEAIICLFEGAIILGEADRSTRALTVARDAALVLLASGAT